MVIQVLHLFHWHWTKLYEVGRFRQAIQLQLLDLEPGLRGALQSLDGDEATRFTVLKVLKSDFISVSS